MSNAAVARIGRRLLSPVVARFGLAAAVVVLGLIYWSSRAPAGYDVAVVGAPYAVGGKEVTRVVVAPIVGAAADMKHVYDLARETVTLDGGAVSTRVRLASVGTSAVDVWLEGGGRSHRNVRVEPVRRLVWAVLLFALIAVLLPYSLARGGSTSAGDRFGPWYALLSEPGGGYSLARVQLLVWFLPTAVLYGGLSFTLQAFGEINSQIAVLIGLSGATTLLGTAASPAKPSTSGEVVPPSLGDLVTDWNAHGDLSRYQYLLLSIVGAAVMVAGFWRQLELPAIPAPFLYLLAGSQGTYLATKAVKNTKAAEAGAAPGAAEPAGSAPRPAPSTMTPAPAGTATKAGSFQPAGK